MLLGVHHPHLHCQTSIARDADSATLSKELGSAINPDNTKDETDAGPSNESVSYQDSADAGPHDSFSSMQPADTPARNEETAEVSAGNQADTLSGA